jgi:hypothetical protein
MSIEGLIDIQVMEHLSLYGNIQRMDSFAQHLLKTSEHPLMVARRTWMRQTALKQCLESQARQKKMSATLKQIPHPKGVSFRHEGVVDPTLAESMRRTHKAEWGDPDFKNFVKREEPDLLPKRETV